MDAAIQIHAYTVHSKRYVGIEYKILVFRDGANADQSSIYTRANNETLQNIAFQWNEYKEKNKSSDNLLQVQTRSIDSLSNQQACTSGFLDLLFCQLGEEFCLDNNRNSDLSISKELEVSLGYKVDHRGLAASVLCCLINTLTGNIEQFVDIDGRSEVSVSQQVKLAHTDLSEITRMVFIHHNTVMVLATSITATTWMLTVLSDTTVSGGNVSSLFAVLVGVGRHDLLRNQTKRKLVRDGSIKGSGASCYAIS